MWMEEMNRERVCCFTGRRPEKLPWGDNEQHPRCKDLKWQLDEVLDRLYERGYNHFICGMARGFDFYCAEAVLRLKQRHPEVVLHSARPCQSQADRFPIQDRQRYGWLLSQCDRDTLVQPHYSRDCMMKRNRFMVDHASHLIALYDGIPSGGTYHTIQYARKSGIDITYLNLEGEVG